MTQAEKSSFLVNLTAICSFSLCMFISGAVEIYKFISIEAVLSIFFTKSGWIPFTKIVFSFFLLAVIVKSYKSALILKIYAYDRIHALHKSFLKYGLDSDYLKTYVSNYRQKEYLIKNVKFLAWSCNSNTRAACLFFILSTFLILTSNYMHENIAFIFMLLAVASGLSGLVKGAQSLIEIL